MSRPILSDAFDHHVWATIALLDACAAFTPEQLETTVPGTFGPLIETLRHTVGADASYLALLSGGAVAAVDEDAMSVADLRAVMERNGAAWTGVVSGDLDPDLAVTRHRDDGSTSTAPLGIRLAQVVHHGTDHRSQVCTALTALGIEPPDIDAWAFAASQGRLSETPPTAPAAPAES